MNTEPTSITVEATISAEPGKTWELWTQPEHITKWNFASDDWHCPQAMNDLRKDGKYSARMEARDGSIGFDFEAVYDEVIDQQRISYPMGDGRQCTTTFQKLGETTKVTTTFDAEQLNSVEQQQAGWQAILNNFKAYAQSI